MVCSRRLILLLLAVLSASASAVAQKNKPGKELGISRTAEPIRIDGVLDEPAWLAADVAKDFFLSFPVDTIRPTHQTEVRLTFDQHFFYISFVCYDDKAKGIMQSLRRDFDPQLNDWVGFSLDPYNDFTNGFYFLVSPFGVQHEGTVSGGGSGDNSFNASWDNKWYSEVKHYDDHWVAELAIPFKSFRYNSQAEHWNISLVRNDLKKNEFSGWIATPIQYVAASFAYSGKLMWKDAPPKAGTNISLIPYLTTSSTEDRENALQAKHMVNGGFDAKVAVTPALNLDLTVNPDFSNVEVDKQVINLTRFEYQFPERRQFFLENSDLFSTPGFTGYTQPFFSRRIGLVKDSSGNLARVPILYGARISGKIGSKWRLGLMNMQTRKKASLGLPEQNYSVAVIQRQILSRSNLDFFFVNAQSLGLGHFDSTKFYQENLVKRVSNGKDTVRKLHLFNRVAGTDFNFITKSNRWGGKVYYHQSVDDFSRGKAYSYGAFINYLSRHVNTVAAWLGMGKNFNAEAGFVPAMSVYPGNYGGLFHTDFKIYPRIPAIVFMGPGIEADYTYIPGGLMTDRIFTVNYAIFFKNTANFNVLAKNTFQKLPSDFAVLDPKLTDLILRKGEVFNWNEYTMKFSSNTRKTFNYSLVAIHGTFYNCRRDEIGGTLQYRFQPYGSGSVTFDYNDISLPPGFGHAHFLLVSPRFDFTFTRKLFLTTFVQYNNRYDNVNLNARFQWRFRPASDFFVVYTENYFPEQLRSKNRALVLKMTYWLNL